MDILVISATFKEIAPFMSWYRDSQKHWPAHLNMDVLITGIGLTATSFHLTKQISIKKPDHVIQAGLAGSFDKRISLGSVVSIQQDTIADESVVELKKLKTLFDLKLVPQDQFPYKKGWLRNNSTIVNKRKLKSVKGISVNQITTSNEMIRFYKKQFNPVTESMEGAALHYVCLMEKIPFLQIRSISNYVGERNKKNWNINDSIANLNRELISIIKKL